jgi:surface antigen Omp85-like protein
MLAVLAAATLALQAPPPPSQDSTAYLDRGARDLVTRAREHRQHVDLSIRAYDATVKERIAVGIRALRRDRMLYRREIAVHIAWRRDTIGEIRVLGAREAIPVALRHEEVPEDLASDVPDLAFDPGNDRVRYARGDSGAVRHPLAPGSEADYRFASGDTTDMTFPDGHTLRLYELKVLPRRSDFRLMSGSLWIEGETFGVVRLLFRPARPFDMETDADSGDHVPGFLKPIRAEIRYVSIEYAQWSKRWWLPREIAMDGVATVAFAQVPVRFERFYDDYDVTGDSASSPPPAEPPLPAAERDSARARCERLGKDVHCTCRRGRCHPFTVVIPPDTAALLTSTELPPRLILGETDSLVTEGDLRELAQRLGDIPAAPWTFRVPRPRWGLARYNRVEGLSLGARLSADLGRLSLAATGRLGLAGLEPDAELAVGRETAATPRLRLAGYYRIAAADPSTRPLGIGNSLAGLLLGRDDGEYFRASGVELAAAPAATLAQNVALRLYAERQRAVRKETDFSIPHAFDAEHLFRPNITAQAADQVGLAATVRGSRRLGSDAATLATELAAEAGAGTFGFGKAALTVRATAPLAGLALGLEAAAGSSGGRVPIQSAWFLGGPATLRGYPGGVVSGEAFWRARAELTTAFPGARLALFSDAGRAAARDHLSLARPLWSAGVGASFLDGLLRVDCSRALRAPTGWRVDFYADGIL